MFKAPSVGGIIGAVGDIYSGITAFKASRELSSDMQYQGNVLYQEALRTADIIIEEGNRFAAGQSLQYLGSGVQIAGSALITIAQTKKYAATEAKATRAKGAAEKYLADRSAKRTENEGRASLVSGITSAATSLFL